ncbi:MAG: hypothetical protein KDD14_25005, partial [Saprospiraceae bacterium]|nr:hypothetical protein [Saprospiraceae bacterium]
MSTSKIYRPLLEVNLYHGYYLHPVKSLVNTLTPAEHLEISEDPALMRGYNILKDLEIRISPESKKLMRGYR